MLPVINSAEVSDLGMKHKEGSEKRGEGDSKKVHHYHSIVQESVRPDIDCISEITKSARNFLDLHLTVLKGDVFVSVLVFTALQVTKLVEVLWLEAIFMDSGNFGFWQSRITACHR